jgi:hypothetical protein
MRTLHIININKLYNMLLDNRPITTKTAWKKEWRIQGRLEPLNKVVRKSLIEKMAFEEILK